MRGRVFGIKKTWFLRGIALFNLLLFVALACVSFLCLKIPNLWFFSLCACIGLYELSKSILFRFDSALYFGALLTNIGANGFVFYLLHQESFAVVFVGISFATASLVTFVLCHQKFHLILAYSISFLTIYSFLLIKNLITPVIFIAFIGAFLIQFIVSIIINIKKGI